MRLPRVLLLVLFVWSAAGAAAAQDLTIAAASDLQPVLPQLVERFERETGRRVRLTLGSSGNFFSQIQNGAPFDLFLSADVDYPRRLIAASLGDSDSLYRYAVGRLAFWTRKDSGIDVNRGLHALTDARVRRIAIANPAHAPYGRAAVAALQQAGLYATIQSRLVLGENIAQAAQFVESGNAEAGIIALSLAHAPALASVGRFHEIPASFHPPLDQAAIIVSKSEHKPAARAFIAFMQRPESAGLMRDFGFSVPAAPSSPGAR